MPGSIFGGDHRNRVAAARGQPPGWGGMLPGQLNPRSSSYVSPLAGGLLQNRMGPPQMSGQSSMVLSNPQIPMGSIPGNQFGGPKFSSGTGPVNPRMIPGTDPVQGKFGSSTGPVNPGGPPVGLPGRTLPYEGPSKFGNQAGPVNPGLPGNPYTGPNPRLFEALIQRKPFSSLRGRSRY